MSSGGGDEHSRSLDDVDDADVDADNNEASNAPSCIVGGKLLKSAEPDLEVAVGQGDDTRTYQHYSVVLASYIDYIDTMLSVPMREQETRRITFPDITPANFDKIMTMHQINGRRDLKSFVNKEEAPILLPLLDKYQFIDALDAWDALLAKLFGGWIYESLTAGDLQNAIAVAQAAHGLNAASMEKSQPKMAKFAIDKLQDMPTSLTAENVKILLSLVEADDNDDDDNVRAIANFIDIACNGDMTPSKPLGKETNLESRISNGMLWHIERDMQQMRRMIRETDFAERLRMRTLQLGEQDDMMWRLVVKRLPVDAPPGESDDELNLVTGDYVRKDATVEGFVSKMGKTAGAKRYCYTKHFTSEDGDAMKIIIEPYDLLGTKWVMTDYEIADDDDDSSIFQFLFFCENEFGSLLPPKYGWKRASREEDDNPNSIFDTDNPTLHYNIESRTW